MKKIKKLKLNQLSKDELGKREMNYIKGGDCCCGCWYAGSGGSSTYDNGMANLNGGGLHSSGC